MTRHMDVDGIKDYLRKENLSLDKEISHLIEEMKKAAISKKDENLANELWCLNEIYDIQKLYLESFNHLKRQEYFEAWRKLELIEIDIVNVHRNFEGWCDDYWLPLIKENTNQLQKAYPYWIFLSRVEIIKKETCSICGKERNIENPCGHTPGKVYMGEVCYMNVEDMVVLGYDVVPNPKEKFCVLFPVGRDYDYISVDKVMSKISSPFQAIGNYDKK